jgi:hypothetical protein
MKNPLVGRLLLGSGLFFFVAGLVLMSLHQPKLFWGVAFAVGLLDLLTASFFLRR